MQCGGYALCRKKVLTPHTTTSNNLNTSKTSISGADTQVQHTSTLTHHEHAYCKRTSHILCTIRISHAHSAHRHHAHDNTQSVHTQTIGPTHTHALHTQTSVTNIIRHTHTHSHTRHCTAHDTHTHTPHHCTLVIVTHTIYIHTSNHHTDRKILVWSIHCYAVAHITPYCLTQIDSKRPCNACTKCCSAEL